MFRTLLIGLLALTSAATAAPAGPASAPTRTTTAAAIPSPERADPFLPGVARILFLGDSITYAGEYVDDIETHLRLRFPGRRFDVVNCGLPSETVSGLSEAGHAGGKFPRPGVLERLDRVLAKVKPDLVVACYGMNDGIYLPPADDRAAAFRKGMTALHERVAAAGAAVVHVTPPVFDPVPIRGRVAAANKADADHPFAGYDDVLKAYGDWLLAQRRAAGWRVVDLHGPMAAAIAGRRKADPAFTFSKDGVHPDAAGHAVMAAAVLRGLDAPFDPTDRAFGDSADPASTFARVRKLVRARGRLLTDAWLTETGHRRPGMSQGLPMDQAKAKAAGIEREIDRLRGMTKSE